ncbi:phosphatase PAP2 family protein [Leeuwenhoekiella sp. A16]|uniref:phosphatase PAP2 family protein n=1 Tax=unclassified Leeuwenhoekiella TaxID=2615029 RepID=UPI003A80CD3B|tara:strand:- start:36399 stop:36962 length:564 start_codon:yes stop_codon:yes gene_type:complete
MESLRDIDQQLFLFLNNLGTETWDPFWIIITGKWYSIPLYAILLFLIYRKFGPKNTLIILVFVAALIASTDQLANVFKHGFQRLRPCGEPAVMNKARFIAARCGHFGYFSAHAASSMGLAIFVGLLLKSTYKYLIFALLFWSVLIGYSRIYVGVHYPGDVLSGMIIGGLLGYLFYLIYRYVLKRFTH